MWARIMQANAACNQVRQCMPSSGSQAQHCQKTYAYCHVYIFKAQAIMGRAKFVVNSFKECRVDVRNFSTLHSCRAKAVAKTSKNAAPPLRKFLDFAYVRPWEPHTIPYTTHTRVHDQPNQIPYTQAPVIQPTLVLPSVDSRPLSPHRLLARDGDFSSRNPLPFPPSS